MDFFAYSKYHGIYKLEFTTCSIVSRVDYYRDLLQEMSHLFLLLYTGFSVKHAPLSKVLLDLV